MKFNFLGRNFGNEREEEKRVILRWISGRINNNEYILLIQCSVFYKLAFEFPYRESVKPRIIKLKKLYNNGDSSSFAFIIKQKGDNIPFALQDVWKKITTGFFFELYEDMARFKGLALPLRFGLSGKEKQRVVWLARLALKKFLEENKRIDFCVSEDFSRRFYMRSDFGVVIWVDGELRGSVVLENTPLGEGIIEGVIKAASKDFRFKPLRCEDLENTRIEIVLMSNLILPLPQAVFKKNELLPAMGYKLTIGDRYGWFLPEVFNVSRFTNLRELLNGLAGKIGLAINTWQKLKSRAEIFGIDDFIEDSEHIGVINFFGPILISESAMDKVGERARLAAEWLRHIQENDGSFLSIVNPLSCSRAQIDWSRTGFSGWALIEYGLISKNKEYIEIGERHLEYLNRYLVKGIFYEAFVLGTPSLLLPTIYCGYEALALFRATNNSHYYLLVLDFADKLLNILERVNSEPFVLQHASSFFAETAFFDNKFLEPAQRFAYIAKSRFEKEIRKQTPQNLAFWAELVNVFDKLYRLTSNNSNREFSHSVADWLIGFQLSRGPGGIFGPFASSTDSDFIYTRGTGKIFEVLAILPEFREAAKKALAWLLAMQYTDENTFFVAPEIKPKIIGGFRHDYFNQEAWIDSAGHFLLGISRFLNLWKQNK